jgi:ankyrin repeat protein
VVAAILAVKSSDVDVNGRDANGLTPLMLASDKEGFVPDEVMELLLSNGARIDEQDPQGNSPLMMAAKMGNISGVEFLLGKGAAVNLKNRAGDSALKFARQIHGNKNVINAEFVEPMVVAILLKAGAKE